MSVHVADDQSRHDCCRNLDEQVIKERRHAFFSESRPTTAICMAHPLKKGLGTHGAPGLFRAALKRMMVEKRIGATWSRLMTGRVGDRRDALAGRKKELEKLSEVRFTPHVPHPAAGSDAQLKRFSALESDSKLFSDFSPAIDALRKGMLPLFAGSAGDLQGGRNVHGRANETCAESVGIWGSISGDWGFPSEEITSLHQCIP